MKINDLLLFRILFKYQFKILDWSIHPRKGLNHVLLDFCSFISNSGRFNYYATALNCFNQENDKTDNFSFPDILFGPFLCFQPQLRGADKWNVVDKVNKSEIDCHVPIFYGPSSNRKTEEAKKNGQYYYKMGTYIESSYDQIGHLETTRIYSDLDIEVRVIIEVLKLENIDDKEWFDLLKKALQKSEIFRSRPENEMDKFINNCIAYALLFPKCDLIPRGIRGRLKG